MSRRQGQAPDSPKLINEIMDTNRIKELEVIRAKLANLEKAAEDQLRAELAVLPAKYGFDSLPAFISALQDAAAQSNQLARAPRVASATAATAPKANISARLPRKRVAITDGTRALVTTLIGEGKTGDEIAKEAGISKQSVHKIKSQLGLTRPRALKTISPQA